MNTKDKNISNAAGDRRTYLSPCTEIIKMNTSNLVMGSPSPLEIPIDTPGATDANGKRWQGDDLDRGTRRMAATKRAGEACGNPRHACRE